MTRKERRIRRLLTGLAIATGAVLLLGSPEGVAAQVKGGDIYGAHVGVALTDAGGGDVMYRGIPDHDLPPPPGLERMSVTEALGYLAAWATGDAAGGGADLQMYAFRTREGRVLESYGAGSRFMVEEEEEMLQTIPARRFMPDRMWESGVGDRRVRGYDLAQRTIPAAMAVGSPERVVQTDEIFDTSRKERLGDVLYVVAAPADRELRDDTGSTVMLVMF